MKNYLKIFVLVLLFLGLAACSAAPEENDPLPPDPNEQNGTVIEVEVTATPTDILVEDIVVMVVSDEADQGIALRTRNAVELLAAESAMLLLVDEDWSAESLTEDVQIVIAVGPGLDIQGMSEIVPGVKFVAVDHPGLLPSNDVFVIGDSEDDLQRQSFMAGYLSALISADNRMAALVPAESEIGTKVADSFVTGARFFCGICRPQFPPYGNFPRWEMLSRSDATDAFQPAVSEFILAGVEVIYVHGELASSELLSYLSEQNILVVSNASPDVVRNHWVGTVMVDPGHALETIWPDLLAGAEGYQLPNSVVLVDRDTGILTQARYRLFEETLAEVEAGLISLTPLP